MICPKCMKEMEEPFVALSRRDNKTKICSDCGVKEAMEDYFKQIHKVEERLNNGNKVRRGSREDRARS